MAMSFVQVLAIQLYHFNINVPSLGEYINMHICETILKMYATVVVSTLRHTLLTTIV